MPDSVKGFLHIDKNGNYSTIPPVIEVVKKIRRD
jgi:hypothetical protein